MSKKSEISITLEAQALGKNLENLADELAAEVEQQVSTAMHAAFATIVAKAQSDLSSTAGDYLAALDFDKVGSDYIISLSGKWPNLIESGFEGFDMRGTLLNSQAVTPNGPWVKESKKGHRYARVPFQHKPFSGATQGSNMVEALKSLRATNSQGRRQRLTSIFKDPSGNPLYGKVATVGKTGNPMLDGIVKYQQRYVNQSTGKVSTQSVYMTFRTISEAVATGWQHPGYDGLNAFQDAEEYVRSEIEKILRDLG